jgi:hypothetical protein
VQSIEVRSALAQGADRLVVEQILQRRDARLVAVLPLTPADYETDFEPEGQVVFARLLERAHEILVVDAVSSREEAYELAGQTIVETSDVLVALWDGGPSRGRGGTAEIVRYARDRQVPVEVVTVNGRRS